MTMSTGNKNGLLRGIPADVQRIVRQRDGFGCVVCGSLFYQYDHIGIEYKDAAVHDIDNIVLLCGGCHDRKNRKALSTESIRKCAANPKCMQDSFSWGALDIGEEYPVVQLGDIIAKRSKTLLRVFGEDLFSVSKPVEAGQPFTINAKIFDRQGNLAVQVIENRIQLLNTNWDAEVVGQRIKIRSGMGIFEAVLRAEPPARVIIERLQMLYKGITVYCKEGDSIKFGFNGKLLETNGGEFEDCDVVVDFDRDGFSMGIGAEKALIKNIEMTQAPSPRLGQRVQLKQGRNELCACGSGEKYKRCHGLI